MTAQESNERRRHRGSWRVLSRRETHAPRSRPAGGVEDGAQRWKVAAVRCEVHSSGEVKRAEMALTDNTRVWRPGAEVTNGYAKYGWVFLTA